MTRWRPHCLCIYTIYCESQSFLPFHFLKSPFTGTHQFPPYQTTTRNTSTHQTQTYTSSHAHHGSPRNGSNDPTPDKPRKTLLRLLQIRTQRIPHSIPACQTNDLSNGSRKRRPPPKPAVLPAHRHRNRQSTVIKSKLHC